MVGEGQDPMDPAGLLASNPKDCAEGLEGSQYLVQDAGRLHVCLHSTQGTGATQVGTLFPEGPFKIADTTYTSLTQNPLPTTLHQDSTEPLYLLHFSKSGKIYLCDG